MLLTEQSPPAVEPWYASGTFWAIAAVVVAVVAIAVGAWAAFRSARPRRALYVKASPALPLLRRAPGLVDRELVLTLDGRELTRPYLVTVTVVNDSAVDIAPAAFGGTPLELDFGVPVLALLEVNSDPGRLGVRDPAVAVHDTALHVGPALLARRHRLHYTVLLDGEPQFQPVTDLVDVPLVSTLVVLRRPPWSLLGAYLLVALTGSAQVVAADRTSLVQKGVAVGGFAVATLITALLVRRALLAERRLRRLSEYDTI